MTVSLFQDRAGNNGAPPSAPGGWAARTRARPAWSAPPASPREIPLFTLDGVRGEIETHHFNTEDKLGLSMFRFLRKSCDDVVLIIHGLTTSTDMFIMPEHDNLVNYLLDHEFTDVFSVDFRMSNRHPYNLAPHRFSFDDVARYDFPATIAAIRRVVGDRRIHVICHCLGSVSFLMSLFAQQVKNIRSVIANSVGLTPRVPGWSQLKLGFAPFLVERVLGLPYLSPSFAQSPVGSLPWLFNGINSLFHRECSVPACHMLSLMWGTGWPALYNHENLHGVTHRRGGDLYGGTGMNYYRHVLKMVQAGHRAVKYDESDPRFDDMPNDYLAEAPNVETPILLVTGGQNHVFADSNVLCYQRLEALVPGRHSLHVFPNYGHQDIFMGKNVARDVFPTFLGFLSRQRT